MRKMFFLLLITLISFGQFAMAQSKTQIKSTKAVAKSNRNARESVSSRSDKLSARSRDEKIKTQYNKRMLKIKHNKKHFGTGSSKRYFDTRRTRYSRNKNKKDASASSKDSGRKKTGWY